MITHNVVRTSLVPLAVLVSVSIFCGCGPQFKRKLASSFNSMGPKARASELVVPQEPFELILIEPEFGQDCVVREGTLVIRGEVTPNPDEDVTEWTAPPLVRWNHGETGEEGRGETSDQSASLPAPEAGGIGFLCEVPLIPGANLVTVTAEWMGEIESIEISIYFEPPEEALGQQADPAGEDGD